MFQSNENENSSSWLISLVKVATCEDAGVVEDTCEDAGILVDGVVSSVSLDFELAGKLRTGGIPDTDYYCRRVGQECIISIEEAG